MVKSLGKIKHYFDKISVAALVLKAALKIGDKVKIKGHGKEFIQEISSMQIEHKPITKAAKNKDVAFRVDQEVKEGDEVVKL